MTVFLDAHILLWAIYLPERLTPTLHHHDPFDWVLIAQALRRDVSILTIDTLFPKYEVQTIW